MRKKKTMKVREKKRESVKKQAKREIDES